MSLVYTGQVITKLVRFAGAVTGTPTAQQYINGVTSGGSVNGTGSGADWVFSVEVSGSAVEGDSIQIEAVGVVEGVTQYKDILFGTVVSTADIEIDSATLDQIKAKTDLIGTGIAFIDPPVTEDGFLDELIIGDDYLAVNGRALEWRFSSIENFTTNATGKFGLKNSRGDSMIISNGVVVDLGDDQWKVSFDLPKEETEELPPGVYDWSAEITEDGIEITKIRNRQNKTRVRLVAKQT